MANLTSQQATILAEDFRSLGMSIGDFRYDHWNELSETERKQLGDWQWSILKSGEDILSFSTVLMMNDVETSLSKIDEVTLEIKSTIHALTNIRKAIDVAAAIVTFGQAIINKDPAGITSGLQNVLNTWKSS